jgi:hypothetical protein
MFPNKDCIDCNDCPDPVVPIPIPDYHNICGAVYNYNCVIYTGPDIDCLGITNGMSIAEAFTIIANAATDCDCCAVLPVDCVLSEWSEWGNCVCEYTDLELTCTQTRTRTIITPASDGGTPCGPLTETRTCEPELVCFTFGTEVCDTYPNPTQVLLAPSGNFNNKPYYNISLCNGSIEYVAWFEETDGLWHIGTSLGNPSNVDLTLDVNNSYYPISNNTQMWQVNGERELLPGNIISTSLNTCPEIRICFNFQITYLSKIYTFNIYTAPNYITGDYNNKPEYQFIINVGGNNVTINIFYDVNLSAWVALDLTNNVELGTLTNDDFYPLVGTWVPENDDSFMISTSTEECTQVPDVDCVLTCGPWSDCVSGTRTRTCTILTPAQGNGISCDELVQTEQCSTPFCFPPSDIIVSLLGNTATVNFQTVAGALEYTMQYTVNGGTPILDVSSTSPFTFEVPCGSTITGSIATQCVNGLLSSSVPFSFTTAACADCFLERPIIGGAFTAPTGKTMYLNLATMNAVNSTLNKPIINNSVFGILQMLTGRIYYGNMVTTQTTGTNVSTNGAAFVNCDDTINTGFFGTGFQKLSSGGSFYTFGTVYTMVKDDSLNRIYVGGDFTRYKGVDCTPNFIVIDALTGNILPNGTFATNVSGMSGNGGQVMSLALQNDGKILVGGRFTSAYGNTSYKYLARFGTNGVLDTTLNLGSGFTWTSLDPFKLALITIKAIYVDTTGNIYVGGYFDQYQGITNRKYLVKISATGLINTTFVPPVFNNTGYSVTSDGCINKIGLQANKLLVVGAFSNVDSAITGGITRLDPITGARDTLFNLLSPVGSTFCEGNTFEVWNNRILYGHSLSILGGSSFKGYHILSLNGVIDPSYVGNPTLLLGSSTTGVYAISI